MFRFALVLLLMFQGVAGAGAQEPVPSPDRPMLRPGDLLRVVVWRVPDMSGEFEVAADGTIVHPLYREVAVAGIPLPMAEDRLRTFLARFESNPQFVMEPLFRVAVGGEVRTPNLYSFPPEVTIAQAIALAGGLSERGRLDRVRLIRDGETVLIDLHRPNSQQAHIPIRSGDQIIVDRRRNVFREYVVPALSVTTAVVTIVNFVLQL